MTSQTLGLCAEQRGSSEMTVKQKQDDILNHIQKKCDHLQHLTASAVTVYNRRRRKGVSALLLQLTVWAHTGNQNLWQPPCSSSAQVGKETTGSPAGETYSTWKKTGVKVQLPQKLAHPFPTKPPKSDHLVSVLKPPTYPGLSAAPQWGCLQWRQPAIAAVLPRVCCGWEAQFVRDKMSGEVWVLPQSLAAQNQRGSLLLGEQRQTHTGSLQHT